jgi:hypothetical protein
MIPSRIFENLLTILILFGLGYIFYAHLSGNNKFERFREKMKRVTGGNNNGRFGNNG